MATNPEEIESSNRHAIIFVLGAPGVGKSTLCAHLTHSHDLSHYSIGDGLRSWMRSNPNTSLALQIQSKLDNQGFLSFDDLNPFLSEALKSCIDPNGPNSAGILFDGFPRCIEQLRAFDMWGFEDVLLVETNSDGAKRVTPDLVLYFEVTKEIAKVRYLARGRDGNDSEEKFERRFAEFEAETVPVVEEYRQRGILISIDSNGTKEENIEKLTKALAENTVWQSIIG